MYEFEATLNGNKTLQKHKDLLKTLSDDRVICIGYEHDGTFYIMECCDEYYYHDMTKEECLELSELFKEIAEEISVIQDFRVQNGLLKE